MRYDTRAASEAAPAHTGLRPPIGLTARDAQPYDIATLREISRRVLWLATSIVDAANRSRPNDTGIKAGGYRVTDHEPATEQVTQWQDTRTVQQMCVVICDSVRDAAHRLAGAWSGPGCPRPAGARAPGRTHCQWPRSSATAASSFWGGTKCW